ncbi:hypothetical protein KQ939_16425 [Planococcus sp. CP5-4]|uniref:hypothetical protein n=1 Tax=unclassified Planococcus (in: firmicutes) TaxID=2662419 RepID=UPI001C21F271|nr:MULTISPECIES: hypothetical protein [unclassified Planococcus (in: firmicutes)]MBU9673909.1 hypothetical protein [Planococcus sp. CP5-4_YE]MBV0909779.1 hypothetical protein [Planococcus sp. CP5-4_UN]MBW6065263.1 hypothetical protein [Planococcus sp. CP5-4]
MMNTQQVTSPDNKTAKMMAAQAVEKSRNCPVGSAPEIEGHKIPQLYIGLPLDRGVSVQLYRDEQQGLNEAKVLIPVGQMPSFMRALIEHPILLPTSYSQSSSVEGGQHLLRITSEEALSDFVERLTDALSVLPRKK